MHKPSLPGRYFSFGLILIVGLASGCSSFNVASSKPVEANAPLSSDIYRVEMYFNHGEPKAYEGNLNSNPTNGPVTVQTALEVSGAVGRYRNMEVTLYRRVEESGKLLKLPIVFQPRTDSVKVEQDYALYPGDRIVIRPVTSGLFALLTGGMSDDRFE